MKMFRYLIITALIVLSGTYTGSYLLAPHSPNGLYDNHAVALVDSQQAGLDEKVDVNADPVMTNRESTSQAYGKLPIHFEPNMGQTAANVDYVARGNGYSLFLTPGEATLSLLNKTDSDKPGKTAVVKMSLKESNKTSKAVGLDALEGRSNYFLGNDPANWQANVPNYKKVQYEEIYPGIDLVYYGNNRQLEYDFIVKPAADPSQIKLTFDGTERPARIDAASGDLLLMTASGELRQHKPIVYQNIDGERHEIASSYKLDGNSASILLGEYDKSRELVIDPILSYGSYLADLGLTKAEE